MCASRGQPARTKQRLGGGKQKLWSRRMSLCATLVLSVVSGPVSSPPPPSFAQTSSLAAPSVTLPQEPKLSVPPPPPSWRITRANASTSTRQQGRQETPWSSASAEDVPPAWWMAGSILTWRLLPFIGIGMGCLICCCFCCVLFKPFLCPQHRHYTDHNPHHRQQNPPSRDGPYRGRYDGRPSSWLYRPRSQWRSRSESGSGWARRSSGDNAPRPRSPFPWHGGSFPAFGASMKCFGSGTRSGGRPSHSGRRPRRV